MKINNPLQATGEEQQLPRTIDELEQWRQAESPVVYRDIADLPDAGPDLLVGLDIDGTILGHDTSLSDEVRSAITDLRASGTHVVLATGRSLLATYPVAERLGLDDGWAISSNGAVIWRVGEGPDNTWRVQQTTTFDPAETIQTLHEAIPSAIFAVEDVGRGFRLNAPFPDGELMEPVYQVPLEDLWREPVVRLTVRAPDVDWQEFEATIEDLGMKAVSYAAGWTAWLDVAPGGISKATALEQVRQNLDVAPGHTVAVGDGGNDVEMLQWAGLGVAMGGARDSVRQYAKADAAPVEHDGLVDVLRQLLNT